MNFHSYFAAADRPVETCIVGAGSFGRSFIAQAQRVPLMKARVAVDRDARTAAEAFTACGIAPSDIVACESAADAKAAWESGRHVAVGDLALVLDLPLDVVVEATGHPEGGARHAVLAIEAEKHLVLVSKEVDSVIGPGLARAARAVNRIVTPVDGDQPSLLIGLVTWAELLGFRIVAAGKSSEYDFVYDERAGTIWSNGRTAPVEGFSDLWDLAAHDVEAIVTGRSRIAHALPQRTVPDLCEMLVVGNSTGLSYDRPDFHVPMARIHEVPTVFAPRESGGLIGGDRRLDVFNCLRRPDEISFAGGVFVVVRCDDAYSWRILEEKGHVLSRDGSTAMLWLPRHLLGLEAATSVLEAAILGRSSGGADPRPHLDLCARADADLAAGTILHATGHHHAIKDVSGALAPGAALAAEGAIPYYLAADRRLVRPVVSGALIRCADVELDEDSFLLKARRRQDSTFFAAGET